jgi:hypothetical protein
MRDCLVIATPTSPDPTSREAPACRTGWSPQLFRPVRRHGLRTPWRSALPCRCGPRLDYDPTSERPRLTEVRKQSLPLLPTIGLRVRF